jgi:hypothetical protein
MPFLTADQKQQCVNVCEELRQIASDKATFFSRVVTGDESCIYVYDPETKQQSSQRNMKSKIKSMFMIFFDSKEIITVTFYGGCLKIRSEIW